MYYYLGTTSNKDICLLLEEFVVLTQLMIFPFWATWVGREANGRPK